MYPDYQNDVFESILNAAVYQNSRQKSELLSDLSDFPNPSSLVCSQKIYRSGNRIRVQLRLTHIFSKSRRILSALAFCLGLCFSVLLLSHEVRSACSFVLTSVCEEYLDFRFIPDKVKSPAEITVRYIPSGYHIVQSNADDKTALFLYENADKNQLLLRYTTASSNIQTDTEHYQVKQIRIHSQKGRAFISTDNHFTNFLIWYDNSSSYLVSGNLPYEELEKIAKNFQ